MRRAPGHRVEWAPPSYAQVRYIRRLFTETFGAETAAEVEVNSVDGFQGIALLENRPLYWMVGTAPSR